MQQGNFSPCSIWSRIFINIISQSA